MGFAKKILTNEQNILNKFNKIPSKRVKACQFRRVICIFTLQYNDRSVRTSTQAKRIIRMKTVMCACIGDYFTHCEMSFVHFSFALEMSIHFKM